MRFPSPRVEPACQLKRTCEAYLEKSATFLQGYLHFRLGCEDFLGGLFLSLLLSSLSIFGVSSRLLVRLGELGSDSLHPRLLVLSLRCVLLLNFVVLLLVLLLRLRLRCALTLVGCLALLLLGLAFPLLCDLCTDALLLAYPL